QSQLGRQSLQRYVPPSTRANPAEEPVPTGSPLSIYVGGGGLGSFLRKERFHIVGPQGILSPLHYRTTKLASKVLSRDQIGKTPSDVKAATIIAPAVTAHCFSN